MSEPVGADEMLDHIEELETKLADAIRIGKDWFEQQKTAHARAVSAEAKLDAMAKVLVEAMVVPEAWMVAGFPDMSSEAREQITASVMKARATIEELSSTMKG